MPATFRTLTAALALTLAAVAAHATPVTTDLREDFENGISRWVDRVDGSPDAVVAIDPLNAGNHVLTFDSLRGGGSLFSSQVRTDSGAYTLSFDYLGLARAGSIAGDLGGYIGITPNRNDGNQFWMAGTGSYETPVALIDDGQWHHYSITMASPVGHIARVMVEDWDGSNGVGRDAYFDNIRLRDAAIGEVPEPGSLALAGVGLLAAAASRRVRRAVRA